MEKKIWNKQNYRNFLEELNRKGATKYRDFHSGLGINKDYLIGIPSPELKNIAKEISTTDYQSFIQQNSHNTYEERMIHGLLLGYLKEDFRAVLKRLDDFLPYIDNWALCDAASANLHIMRKNLPEGFIYAKKCLKSKNSWVQRFGFVLLLGYHINDEYVDDILEICNSYKTDEYYVKMAIAWLISVCYIRYPDKTAKFLKSNNLSPWIQNKSIQKIRESRRVNDEEKERLNLWKK